MGPEWWKNPALLRSAPWRGSTVLKGMGTHCLSSGDARLKAEVCVVFWLADSIWMSSCSYSPWERAPPRDFPPAPGPSKLTSTVKIIRQKGRKERQRRRDLPAAGSFPKWLQKLGWGRMKIVEDSSVFHMGCWDPKLRYYCFPGGSEVEQPGQIGCQTHRPQINKVYNNISLSFIF